MVLVGLVSGQQVVAAEPIFGFMDGKFYDESQSLKYVCFMDGNCYDLEGTFVTKRTIPTTSNVNIPMSVPTIADPVKVIPTSVEVNFTTLVGYTILPGKTFADILIPNARKGDKITLTVNGQVYEKTFDDNYINQIASYLNLNVPNLTSATQYPFTLRVDRGDEYGITNGSLTTKL